MRLRRITMRNDGLGSDGTMSPRSRTPPAGGRLAARLACAAALIAALSLAAREGRTGPEAAAPPALAEAPAPFVPRVSLAVRPAMPAAVAAPRFRLDDADALEPARPERTRLDPASGRREETLGQGAFTNIDTPYLRLVVGEARPGDPPRNLFVTLARRAADGPGLSVIRTGERGRLATRFGAVETLEATFSGSLDRICTGFSGSAGEGFRFDGWLCAPLGQAPEPRAVACTLDALVAIAPEISGFDGPRDPACRPAPDTRTGSPGGGGTRKNEARMRRTAQARP